MIVGLTPSFAYFPETPLDEKVSLRGEYGFKTQGMSVYKKHTFRFKHRQNVGILAKTLAPSSYKGDIVKENISSGQIVSEDSPLDSIVSKLDQEAASVALKESPLDLPKESYPTSTTIQQPVRYAHCPVKGFF